MQVGIMPQLMVSNWAMIFPEYKHVHPPLWLERSRWFIKVYALKKNLFCSKRKIFSDTDVYVRSLIIRLVLTSYSSVREIR